MDNITQAISGITKKSYIIAGGIVAIVALAYTYLRIRRSVFEAASVGYYRAPDSFARQTGVTSLDVIITDATLFGNLLGFIMADDDVYPFTMAIHGLGTWNIDDASVTFDGDGALGIPKRANLTISHGRLILEDDETVYVAAEWIPVF